MSRNPSLFVSLCSSHSRSPVITYTSASGVSRVLLGRKAGDVPPLLGSLFAICPASQQLAANLALAAARSERMPADEFERQELASKLETVREHGFRIFLGWAASLGEDPDREAAARLNALTRSKDVKTLAVFLEQMIFGMAAGDWLGQRGKASAEGWALKGDSIAARFVSRAMESPAPVATAFSPAGLLARYAAHPFFDEVDVGSVASHHLARLIDLANVVTSFSRAGARRPGTIFVQEGKGRASASVPCSRGSLTHRVALQDDIVLTYEIVSPTDAAFGEQGHGRNWLADVALVSEQHREDAARDIVHALDPCVEYKVALH